MLSRLLGVRIPYVITLQDGDPFERVFGRWFIRPFLPLLRAAFRRASSVTVLSTYLARWARAAGYPRTPLIVPNGADIARFENAQKKDIGRTPGETWLVTSSRLVYKNGLDDVIRALAELPRDVRFLVCGAGPARRELEALARAIGVAERVVFKGYVSHEELPGFLAACDIFIRPSRTEGFGASFTEAMAAGLPIIATQEGGIADFLFDEKRNPDKEPTGFAVERDAPNEIAEAVREILADPRRTRQVVDNARRLVRAKYDWDTIARDMREVLLGVCAS
jgi:phosphatidylinositol alpha-1,6-mannosyltransferase